MSRILVIPDTHLKSAIFDLADQIMKDEKIDYAVQLGDNIDDFYSFEDDYRKHNARMVLFNIEHPNTVWLWGNHEVSYLINRPVTGNAYCGKTYAKLYEDNFNPKLAHIDGKYIFSHAGIFGNFISQTNDMFTLKLKTAEDVVNRLNILTLKQCWSDITPLWARHRYDTYLEREPLLKGYKQIIGHTPEKEIVFEEDIISTDVFSTNWGKKLGSEKLLMIDTETDEIKVLENYDYRKDFLKETIDF